MLPDNSLANRQPQSGSITTPTETRFKDVVNLVRPDAAAGIGELDHYIVAIRTRRGTQFVAHGNSDCAARRCMANRVRNQVENHLLQCALIAHHEILAVISPPLQRDRGLMCERLRELDRVADQAGQGNRCKLQRSGAMEAQHIVSGRGKRSYAGAQIRNPFRAALSVVLNQFGK
jgi:hypothetical protein